MSFNPYEYRNDTEALQAAEVRIAELEKLVAAYEKLRRFQHVSGAIESVFCDIDALLNDDEGDDMEDYPPCYYCGSAQCDCDTL